MLQDLMTWLMPAKACCHPMNGGDPAALSVRCVSVRSKTWLRASSTRTRSAATSMAAIAVSASFVTFCCTRTKAPELAREEVVAVAESARVRRLAADKALSVVSYFELSPTET